MRIQQHGNHLIQLTYYGFVNVYLVREADGFTLVDTALQSCARSIVQVARQFEQPIKRIMLTHAHADHSGGLDAVHELVPQAEFVMPARDARFLTGDRSLDTDEPRDKLRGGWVLRKTPPTRLLHEGDRVGSLEVIATPGHTPDAVSLLDRANGLLFTGDTYYPAPIWLFRPETDLDAYAASIQHLAALAPNLKLVLGAHNIPVASPTVLPRLVRAFAAVRAGKVAPAPASPGRVLYKVDGFSFLMRAPASQP